jgi:hypothetical protein
MNGSLAFLLYSNADMVEFFKFSPGRSTSSHPLRDDMAGPSSIGIKLIYRGEKKIVGAASCVGPWWGPSNSWLHSNNLLQPAYIIVGWDLYEIIFFFCATSVTFDPFAHHRYSSP